MPVDVGALLEEGLGDLLALRGAPVTGLRELIGDRDVAGSHVLAEALAAIDGGRRPDVADQLPHDVRALARAARTSRSAALRPSSGEVGADVGGVEVFGRVDPAVLEDDGLAGILGFLQNGVPARCLEGGEDDDVDLIVGDEVAERRELVLHLVLGVVELEVDAELLGGVLERRGVGGAPATLGAGLDEPDGQVLIRQRARLAGGGC